jgi:aspartyl protease family protein
MSGALGLGAILFGMAILVARFAERPIGGLPPEEFAALAAFGGIALVMTSWILNEFRYRWTEGLRALLVWGATFAILVAAYVHKGELETVLDRIIGEVSPGRTVVTQNGEVVVARRASGGFTLRGRINDREAGFIFDTGASAVVLTSDSATAAGLGPDKLTFSVPVSTANGRTLAAPVILDSVTIGPIVERRVEALVARPGVLHENLLGMTFLERLGSYEVRGNRLILRSRS